MKEHMCVRDLVKAQIRHDFGDPIQKSSVGDRWRIAPFSGAKKCISVLMDSSSAAPAVWVFDPYDWQDGVVRAIVQTPEQVERLMRTVRSRVHRALLLHRTGDPKSSPDARSPVHFRHESLCPSATG